MQLSYSKNIKILKEIVEDILDSKDALIYSYEKSKNLGIKNEYTYDEQEVFEAFSSRFARSSDILLKKLFKIIAKLEQEHISTNMDLLNFAEKIQIIESLENQVEIRELRNTIAHIYANDIIELYDECLRLTPFLIKDIDKAVNFTKRYSS